MSGKNFVVSFLAHEKNNNNNHSTNQPTNQKKQAKAIRSICGI